MTQQPIVLYEKLFLYIVRPSMFFSSQVVMVIAAGNADTGENKTTAFLYRYCRYFVFSTVVY
jgi:hypothetical protein